MAGALRTARPVRLDDRLALGGMTVVGCGKSPGSRRIRVCDFNIHALRGGRGPRRDRCSGGHLHAAPLVGLLAR